MTVSLNQTVNRLVISAYKRAENPSDEHLQKTFVPISSLESSLRVPEHQVLYGRRGTGKTHMLRYLGNAKRAEGVAAVYVDLRRIGSSPDIYGDPSTSITQRATVLLVDVIEAIHTSLLELVITDPHFSPYLGGVGQSLDLIAAAATQVEVRGIVETEVSSTSSRERGRRRSIGGKVQRGLSVEGSAESSQVDKNDASIRRNETGVEQFNIIFGQLTVAMRKLVEALPTKALWIMLDEWSSIPLDLQPFLADLLRRNAFTVPGIAVKIGAIERRSQFMLPGDRGEYIGIEPSSDTSATLDIDDYLTFDHDRSNVADFFQRVLFKHVDVFMQDVTPESRIEFSGPEDLLRVAFEEGPAFPSLITASEGVPRDALQIAAIAATLAGGEPISEADIRHANRDYFRRDKEGQISAAATRALDEIVRECVRQGVRVIALARSRQSSKQVVQELFDARLLHRRAQRTYLPGDETLQTYDLFLVDFGCFVDLIQAGRVRTVDDGGPVPRILSSQFQRDLNAGRPSAVRIPRADKWT